jgi:hypothetical protein
MSNGDLDGGCLEAVREFSRARTDRTLQVSPRYIVVFVGGTDSKAKDAGGVTKDEKAGTGRQALFS